MDKQIELLIQKAMISTNNFESIEYLRQAKNMIYDHNDWSNIKKIDYLKKLEQIAFEKNLPS